MKEHEKGWCRATVCSCSKGEEKRTVTALVSEIGQCKESSRPLGLRISKCSSMVLGLMPR